MGSREPGKGMTFNAHRAAGLVGPRHAVPRGADHSEKLEATEDDVADSLSSRCDPIREVTAGKDRI